MKSERIELRFRMDYPHEVQVLKKIRNYDKSRYSSMNDYILHAVRAYEEPLEIMPEAFEEKIREMLRDELHPYGDSGFM